jgi:hypothetical protein
MLAREQSLSIEGFKGLDKSMATVKPGYTRSLLNVYVRDGKVKPRWGVDYDATFSTAMSENICGLMPYTALGGAVTLLRMGASKIEKSTNAGAWSDITGTALTGAATDRPQHAMFRDALYWTNEGQDRPRYWAGTGNTNVISTAPWAKGLMSYMGFLFLLNVSEDGTTFETRRARYSEDPQNDWTLCEGNELNFHETQGAVLAGGVFGRTAAILKEDGIIYLRWIGGPVRFAQELAKGAPGTLFPLAGQAIGEKGYIYLATDYELYIITPNDIIPVPPRVNDILQNTLNKTNAPYARSCVVESEEQYNLFFPLDANGGNTGRLQFNYRNGEFSYSTYPSHAWDAIETVRWTATAAESVIGAEDTITYTLDKSGVKTDETGASSSASVSRYIDTDWVQYTNINEGRVVQAASKFTGATFIFKAAAHAKCKVSVAFDKKNDFRFAKTYDLRPVHRTDEYVAIRYDLPPMECEWVNVRIEPTPSTTIQPELQTGWLHFVPEPLKRDTRRTGRMSE